MASPSLNANNKPGWFPRLVRGIAARIDPEIYSQGPIEMTRYGVIKRAKGRSGAAVFGEFEQSGNQFAIERPGGGDHLNPEKALANNRGYVYAAVNAKAREVMNIDFRLFEVNGEDHNEKDQHPLLDLLDNVNPDMIGSELKYLTSTHLDLVGNCYWLMTDNKGKPVSNELTKPEAIYLLDPSKTKPVIDDRSFPLRVIGYQMKLGNRTFTFDPESIIHFRRPDPSNFFEGLGLVQAAADYIDNDNYAMEFNRKFFQNGARPSGFLQTEGVSENQLEAIKVGFAEVHGGIDNMNRIAVLPKGVKWQSAGTSPKDMDFKNLSEDMRDRILAILGASKTILGTAEADTNRATAETADYVFSKRVVKPQMQLICGFLNEKLVPRYGDNLYVNFLDPVPEDRAARATEMQTAVGSQAVLTVNEARDEYMGLGPVEGGDVLRTPTNVMAATDPATDDTTKPSDGKTYRKAVEAKVQKAANGKRVAFRPARTKLQARAKARKSMAESLAETVKEKLIKNLKGKKFESTKEQDEARWKEFSEYTHQTEKEITETIQKLNSEQKKEVLANLPDAIKKDINPADLYDIEKWISITTDALTPIIDNLFIHQADAAAKEIGQPDMQPFNDTTREAVHRSVELMSRSYNHTTREVLETKINEGLQTGASLSEITQSVEQVYEWSNEVRAGMVAKTESFRTANDALKTAWKQSGVVTEIKWYTSSGNPCVFCSSLDGTVVSIDSNFLNNGDTLTIGDKTMTVDYSDVGNPPLHPRCMCFIRPETVTI